MQTKVAKGIIFWKVKYQFDYLCTKAAVHVVNPTYLIVVRCGEMHIKHH